MARQFVGVEFKAGGRPYSFHNDGDPLASAISSAFSSAAAARSQRQWRSSIEGEPPFETKPIIGLAEPELEQQLFTKEQ
jgi:hypothetical protein